MAGEDRRRGYHHGNLREALVAAAQSLIAEKGPGGVTFAEAARAAGVSPAAPYRHFKDRDALLEEVACRGFDRFAEALEAAWDGGRPAPIRAFEALGTAYLRFAATEPALFAAMFRRERRDDPDPGLIAASERAFSVLYSACDTIAGLARRDAPPPAHMMAYHIWALSHGTAELFSRPGPRRAPISAEDLLETGLGIYLRGLGVLPADDISSDSS
ncbi:MAG: TetR/AcrR family transcriptional regulator [Pseudomonadota bacterium]